ncbi:MAG: hypothetical protein J6Y07_03255 [Alphaproteobacteria bacterium]|nr:hypothetical protein [Alphaproteobacteria bacterium]
MKREKMQKLGWALVAFGAIAVCISILPDGNRLDESISGPKPPVFSKEEFKSRGATNTITFGGAMAMTAGLWFLVRATKKRSR